MCSQNDDPSQHQRALRHPDGSEVFVARADQRAERELERSWSTQQYRVTLVADLESTAETAAEFRAELERRFRSAGYIVRDLVVSRG